MLHIARCRNKDCSKKDRCERFKEESGAVVDLGESCAENDYKWFYKAKLALDKSKEKWYYGVAKFMWFFFLHKGKHKTSMTGKTCMLVFLFKD